MFARLIFSCAVNQFLGKIRHYVSEFIQKGGKTYVTIQNSAI